MDSVDIETERSPLMRLTSTPSPPQDTFLSKNAAKLACQGWIPLHGKQRRVNLEVVCIYTQSCSTGRGIYGRSVGTAFKRWLGCGRLARENRHFHSSKVLIVLDHQLSSTPGTNPARLSAAAPTMAKTLGKKSTCVCVWGGVGRQQK